MSFENLTPDTILNAVEKATGRPLTSLTIALPSYINRVYEVRTVDGEKLIAKFYRPDRWTLEALQDEHRFVLDCQETEIPVVAPLSCTNGETIYDFNGIHLAIFPKRAGRQMEINTDEDWLRLGSLIGRLHCAGVRRPAAHRITMHPRQSTHDDVEQLCRDVIPANFRERFRQTAVRIIETGAPLFDRCELMRIHGDCHRGNILDRLDEGLQLIDFDDMCTGPAVQDLWLLLPDRAANARHEIELFIEGYERFRRFDRLQLHLIETLRAMRMIYFLGWCSRQRNDFQFKRTFPDWGSDAFWQREVNDLREQLAFIVDDVESPALHPDSEVW